MTKHTDGKWTRSLSGKKHWDEARGKGNQKGIKTKQQWCFICAEPHEYHKDERNV